MSKDRIYVRIRKGDKVIREHFDSINESDYSYEARRLLELAIKSESKSKENEVKE